METQNLISVRIDNKYFEFKRPDAESRDLIRRAFQHHYIVGDMKVANAALLVLLKSTIKGVKDIDGENQIALTFEEHTNLLSNSSVEEILKNFDAKILNKLSLVAFSLTAEKVHWVFSDQNGKRIPGVELMPTMPTSH